MCERQWVADYAYGICQKHLNQSEISAPANRERKQSGSIEEERYAVKHIGSVFKQVCSERIMMALLFFFKFLA